MIQYFPKILNYDFGQTYGSFDMVDIFKSINLDIDSPNDVQAIQIKEGERPDQLAYRLYGSFNDYWSLLLTNQIKNPILDWNNYNSIEDKLSLYKTKVLQFGNTSRFLSGLSGSHYENSDIDSFSGVDFSGLEIGDSILLQWGITSSSLVGVGVGGITSNVSPYNNSSDGILRETNYNQNYIPFGVNTEDGFTLFGAGDYFSCGLKNRALYVWGNLSIFSESLSSLNSSIPGQIINNYYISQNDWIGMDVARSRILVNSASKTQCYGNCAGFVEISGAFSIQKIAAVKPKYFKNALRSTTGISYYCFIDNGKLFQKGTEGFTMNSPPKGDAAFGITGIIDIDCGSDFCLAIRNITSTNDLIVWSRKDSAVSGVSFNSTSNPFIKVAAGSDHWLALKKDGTIINGGTGIYGQLNIPSIPSGVTFVDISCGDSHSAFLTSDGIPLFSGKIRTNGVDTMVDISDLKIHGKYVSLKSGFQNILLKCEPKYEYFLGTIDFIDNNFKRIFCKTYSTNIETEELFEDAPDVSKVIILDAGGNVKKELNNKFLAIQNYKNHTVNIVSESGEFGITPQLWKSLYIIDFKNAENNENFITLNKQIINYFTKYKYEMLYLNNTQLEQLNQKIRDDRSRNLNIKVSDITP